MNTVIWTIVRWIWKEGYLLHLCIDIVVGNQIQEVMKIVKVVSYFLFWIIIYWNNNFILNIIFFNFVIYFFIIKIATILLFYFSLGQLNDSRVEKDDPLKGNISKKDTNDGEGIFFIFSVFYFILYHWKFISILDLYLKIFLYSEISYILVLFI